MLNTLKVTLTDLIANKVSAVFARQEEIANKALKTKNRKPVLCVEEVETRIAPGYALYR
ncbi:MAG: hypothetical protein HYU64_11580 [Armatimonadetes bacterium]|nr:hypothetical protein [Armatimonadota bacterium]